jgi:hypothetical protein
VMNRYGIRPLPRHKNAAPGTTKSTDGISTDGSDPAR